MHGHGDGDITVAKDALKREDISPVHHVMTGEGVPEYVRQLLRRRVSTPFIGSPECRSARAEQSPWTR